MKDPYRSLLQKNKTLEHTFVHYKPIDLAF